MKIAVEFEECLKDSPRFRKKVTSLRLLVKLCIGMIDAGKAYNTANKQFVNGQLNWLIRPFFFFPLSSQILFDQAQRSIKTQLQTFVKEDLRKFKESKKHFDKVSEEKEAALARNAQAPRNKQHEVEEATNILTATRKCFRHIVLDYVLQINVLQSKRRSEILKSMLTFMYAHLTFFHQGYDLFSELQPLMKQLGGQVGPLIRSPTHNDRHDTHTHTWTCTRTHDFSNDDTKLEYNVDAEKGIAMEGYLFKRASNAFKTWNRRWFSIQNNQLVYQKKFKDNPTVVVEDLRLCTVKHCEDVERRFCFEVVSPTKSCMMQADSEKLRQAWIKAVQNSIATAFRERGDEEELDRRASTSTGSLDSGGEPKEKPLKGESALQKVLTIPGNSCCCDCGQPDPRWASINLGITLCIQCSGIHRSLGVHFSKVRSLTLDTWEPELLKLMCGLGNQVVNGIFEARREELVARKPQPGDPRQDIEAYIKAKYVERRFVRRPSDEELRTKVVSLSKQEKRLSSSNETPPMAMPAVLPPASPCREPVFYEPKDCSAGLQLYWAAGARSLPDMAEALAHGAPVNWVNAEDQKRTPLIMAVQGGSLVTCEFLLQNAANVNQQDAQGRAPLHHATILGHTGQVCLFLKRGANQNAADMEEKTPLSMAVEAANADIVTLLRLAKMNEEMREAEGYSPAGDETYQDIFQDFTQMASNDPELLNRYEQYNTPRPGP
uniref:Arf-GAP with coiled-coil, ANK repeat and PH domain-containing protein n=1 Tax=Gadus morhua TaxID=8049 RepID=A0A8C5CX72_GADMO